MELTQLQWQNVGKKFSPIWWQINIWSSDWNQIQNNWLPSNAAQININNWKWEIKQMHPSSPVFVNWNQINKSSPVNFWDTISVWTSNNVVLWAHPKWENLNSQDIWKHLWSLNFSWEQISELTNKIFNFKSNEAIHKKMFVLIWFLSFLLFWIIFWYIKLMWIWDEIQKEKNILNWKLIEINNQLEIASSILWKDLTEIQWWKNEDCDPGFEECDISNSESEKSLFVQISELNSNISKLKSEQKKAISEMKKIAENPSWKITETEKEKQEELEKIIKENQKNINLINENFSKIVKNLQNDVKDFSNYKDEIKIDVKNIKKFSEDFNSEKNILNEENQIRDNKLKSVQSDIDTLEKKDDKIDIELKKIQEEINSLELKIKNL